MSWQAVMAQTVAALDDEQLCAMTRAFHLNHRVEEPSGETLAICILEQATRFARNIEHRTSNIEQRREEQES